VSKITRGGWRALDAIRRRSASSEDARAWLEPRRALVQFAVEWRLVVCNRAPAGDCSAPAGTWLSGQQQCLKLARR